MLSTARVPSRCATCQASRFLEVGQNLVGGELKWFERFSCECGHGFETGGAGLPSPGLRKQILDQSGRGEVWIDEKSVVPKVVLLLVKGFGIDEAVAKRQLATLPAVAFQGTHVEAAFVSAALLQGGVTARVVNHLPKK